MTEQELLDIYEENKTKLCRFEWYFDEKSLESLEESLISLEDFIKLIKLKVFEEIKERLFEENEK